MRVPIALPFLLILCAGSAISQQPQYEVSVKTVTVWVKATDDGKPVEGLKGVDFQIYEDDRLMAPTCFEELVTPPEAVAPNLAIAPLQTPTVPAVTPILRRFVIFLDLFNTSQEEYLRVRPVILQFLEQLRGKDWDVMLVDVLPNGKMRVVAPPAPDLRRIRNALLGAQGSGTRDAKARERKRLVTYFLELAVSTGMSEVAIEKAYKLAQTYAVEEKSDAEYSLAALETLETYLSKTAGQEHIVVLYVSGGFNGDPGRRYFDMVDRVVEGSGDAVDFSGYRLLRPWSVRDLNFDLQSEVRKSIGKLNRKNITVYAINTRGAYLPDQTGERPGAYDGNDPFVSRDYMDSMWRIAKETGGIVFENGSDFTIGFDRVLADVSHQYIVCYSAPAHDKPGQYHKIKVVSKRPGLELRYRQGYVD